jgi:hypothetical protein
MNDAWTSQRLPRENHLRSLRELVRAILDELKDFANTRFRVLSSELHATLDSIKVAVPLALIALLLGLTAFLLLTAAVVAIIAHAFASTPYAWFVALIIVGVIWLVSAAVTGLISYNKLRARGGFPKRTVEVLKADKAWIQSETNHGRDHV